MTAYENLSNIEKDRVKLHRDVHAICKETCHFLGLEITKSAVEIIAELVFKKLSVYASDLESFALHAKRNTIKPEDVKLLVRRNPSLKKYLDELPPTNAISSSEKRRKTTVSIAKQSDVPETPLANLKTISLEKVKTDTPKDGQLLEKMAVDDTIDLTFD